MSKNIKDIGKKLLGQSLNSFHRKTGLTQLEKNNEVQDGILNGILNQVDDAYIEKTEQSNVIHLEGSGDGAVILDSIEGNTMVNLVKLPEVNERTRNTSSAIICLQIGNSPNSINLKTNATYTCFVGYDIKNISSNCQTYMEGQIKNSDNSLTWFNTSDRPNSVGSYRIVKKVDTSNISKTLNNFYVAIKSTDGQDANATIKLNNIMLLEGDWTDKEIPQYFEGLQSSFEESATDEGKYEIEILCNNKNLFDEKLEQGDISTNTGNNATNTSRIRSVNYTKVNPNTKYTFSRTLANGNLGVRFYNSDYSYISYAVILQENVLSNQFVVPSDCYYIRFIDTTNDLTVKYQLEKSSVVTEYTSHKQNKIKLLLNSPLLKGDKLVVKDGKLCHYHKMKKIILNGSDNESWIFAPSQNTDNTTLFHIRMLDAKSKREVLCDKFGQRRKDHNLWASSTETDYEAMFINHNRDILTRINTSKLSSVSMGGFKQWLKTNNVTVIYELEEPYYEEVLNEYGEPILLEGYENGAVYIDSTIVPTTTVRYTPKMESFKTLKEVENNNIMLTNDVNDNIIPYMMDVDLMIMEKEMALTSQYKIRRIGAKDMTSMQKRTQDMLERLIKGKTLTEQECKTRVTTYLNAGKITDAQAEELMLLISEVYA